MEVSISKEHDEKSEQMEKHDKKHSEPDKISISITTKESVLQRLQRRSPTREEKPAVEINPLVASTSISPSTSSSMSERSRSKSPSSECDQSFEKDLERKYLRKIHYYILDILHHIVEADRSSTANNCSSDSSQFIVNQTTSVSTTPPQSSTSISSPSVSNSFSSSTSSTTLSPASGIVSTPPTTVQHTEEKLSDNSPN